MAEWVEGDFVYELLSGPGEIDPSSGLWTWAPEVMSTVDSIEVAIRDTVTLALGLSCELDVYVTNNAPQFVSGCGTSRTIGVYHRGYVVFEATDDDCDDLSYYLVDKGGVHGAAWFSADTLFYIPDDWDFSGMYTMTVGVSDGELRDENCEVSWNIICCTTTDVVIEAETGPSGKGVIQGQFADVEVGMPMTNFEWGMGGFNFLLAYDAAALSYHSATPGELYDSCAWEYFTYRYGADGNCGDACPSGLVRIVGIAQANNGSSQPMCPYPENLPVYWAGTLSLATLTFLVSNDRALECQFVPIRFYWASCGDNTLSSADGNLLFLHNLLYDYGETDPVWSIPDSLPSFDGAPSVCLIGDKTEPIRHLDFIMSTD
jgi:hypothetical protein